MSAQCSQHTYVMYTQDINTYNKNQQLNKQTTHKQLCVVMKYLLEFNGFFISFFQHNVQSSGLPFQLGQLHLQTRTRQSCCYGDQCGGSKQTADRKVHKLCMVIQSSDLDLNIINWNTRQLQVLLGNILRNQFYNNLIICIFFFSSGFSRHLGSPL